MFCYRIAIFVDGDLHDAIWGRPALRTTSRHFVEHLKGKVKLPPLSAPEQLPSRPPPAPSHTHAEDRPSLIPTVIPLATGVRARSQRRKLATRVGDDGEVGAVADGGVRIGRPARTTAATSQGAAQTGKVVVAAGMRPPGIWGV